MLNASCNASMSAQYSIEIYLPVFGNSGRRNPKRHFLLTRSELVDEFGGVTAYNRSPATGLWAKPEDGKRIRDDIIIYEVLASRLNRRWWKAYKMQLTARFAQQTLLIRSHRIELL
jgi:hypothetical protein